MAQRDADLGDEGGGPSERHRRGLARLFAGHGLYEADDDPFADQRRRVDAPMRRLFTVFGRRYWPEFSVGLLAGVLGRFLDLLPPILLGLAIDAVFVGDRTFSLPLVPDAWLPSTPAGVFWVSASLIGASFLLAAVFHWARAKGLNAFAQHVQHDVRTETYDRMQRLEMAFFDDKQTGELMSVLSSDVNNLDQFLKGGMDQLTMLVVTVGGTAVILLGMNPQLALVTLSTVPVIAVFTRLYVQRIQPRYKATRESLAELFSRLENNLTGILVIKTSATEAFEHERVAAASGAYRDRNWSAISLSNVFFPSQRVLAGTGFVATFVVGGLWVFTGEAPWVFSGTLTVGEFVAFILLSQQVIGPMSQFGNLVDIYQRAHASAERLFGLMDEADAAAESRAATGRLEDPEGRVEYDGVSFGYGDDPILRDVSFTAEPGESIALVGPSGSGKSTVLKLLPRLYDADAGSITVDGEPVEALSTDSLRGAIGYVSQDPFMFFGTVRENIAYGVEDATDEDVVAAAKAANAHQFVQNLPEGYDTEVGQRGGRLSGGQRQRLSIARAVLRDPEILILDEATSAVDTETELLIQTALERVTEDRTTFAVAHRLSTVRDADRILVLDDGEVVERGTHEELLAEDGLYARLWEVQSGLLDDLPPEFVERALARTSRIRPAD